MNFNNIKKTNILVIGTFWSGSSAVLELFRGHSNFEEIHGEFNLFRNSRYLRSLNNLSHKTGYFKLLKKTFFAVLKSLFLVDFLEFSIKTSLKWFVNNVFCSSYNIESWNSRPSDKRLRFNVRLLKHLLLAEVTQSRISCDVLFPINSKKCYRLFDQAVYLNSDRKAIANFFNDYFQIITIRDPEDQLAEIIRQGQLFNPMTIQMSHDDFSAQNSQGDKDIQVKLYCDLQHRKFDKVESLSTCKNILVIKFEDFVLKHNSIVQEISSRLNFDLSTHRTQLNLEKSKENIGIKSILQDVLSDDSLTLLNQLNTRYQKLNFECIEF